MNGMTPEKSQHEGREPGKRPNDFWQTYRDFAPYLALGFQLGASVVLFFLIGYWIDNHFGTGPTFKLVGLFLGTVGGLIKFFKTVSELGKNKKS